MVQVTPGASSLSHQLAVTFFNINDMQAAALYVGEDCIARSDTIPVSAIESVFNALTKKPQMTKSIIEKSINTPFCWSHIDAEIQVEFINE